ncbi:FAD-dependent oxidoreductase [sulfur-oxidizing endosymbiont of Gigantopelta aegis]|uniref:FAD-dependent oxidoreductase n=1 Tax=sulfur-oxidizing endosymbiont of Gigantopelta aegis TaxID=2794934 RepID=UPI0018DB46B7|nr:FAD-dependent oxidoreductase [sulfur-oxidizing endosymbiont of Gigantopelta aegis]
MHRLIEKLLVNTLTFGIESLFKSNKIDWIQGQALIESFEIQNKTTDDSTQYDKQIKVLLHNKKEQRFKTKHIIIATGSSPVNLSIAPIDDEFIVDSTGALAFNKVPKKLGIIGSGVIGLELGSVWKRLGSEVTIFEAQDTFLAFADQFVAKESLKLFQNQGLNINLNTRLLNAKKIKKSVQVSYTDAEGEHSEKFDKLIIAVGRKPNSENLSNDEMGLVIDEGGFVHVNEHCQTSIPGVYAIGDVVRGPMLAHKGSEEGSMVAELIAGRFREVNYDLIPSVIYTHPEVAWVGKTEQALKAAGIDYKIGTFPFAASGRAQALNETPGMVKIISDAQTDRILGVHILGSQASELIAQAVISMEFGASAEDIALMMFAHPTFSEAYHEASLAVSGRAIHIKQRKSKI